MHRHIARLLALALLFATPLVAQQNATVQGTVLDESRGVLPGVTVTATEINTGRQSIVVTLEDGRYRLENLPPGRYKLRIELPGFATTEIPDLELLVGANATVPPITMKVASLEETVDGERRRRRSWTCASSQVSGNIDRRQMAELPLQGRNWQELSLMVKGITANSVGNTPGVDRRSVPAQSRWPADHAARRRLGLRPAQGEPRGDRRVPDRHQHVRHHAGPLDRHAGAGVSRSGTNDLQARPSASSAATSSTSRSGRAQGAAVLEPADRLHARRADRSRTRCTSSGRTNTSATRRRRPDADRAAESDLVAGRDKDVQKNYLARVDLPGVLPRRTASACACSAGRSTARSRSRAAPPTRRWPSNQQYYSTNLYGTWTRVISNSNLTMQVHGGTSRFSWYNDPHPVERTCRSTRRRSTCRCSSSPTCHSAGSRTSPTTRGEHLQRARGHELAHRQARHQVRRRVPQGPRHQGVDLNRRGTYVFNTPAVDARFSSAAFPADAWDDPSRWDLSGARTVPAAVRHHLPRGLSG